MRIELNKSFGSREELDGYIRSNFGEDSKANKDITLEVSQEEMDKLSLDQNTTVHGVRIRKK